MIPDLIKRPARAWFRPGSEHRVWLGPLRGLRVRLSASTGLAALYSGNERANQKLYARLVRPGDVVVDAGANWGMHTLLLARLTGPAGQVVAFEPHPGVVEELRHHVRVNGFHQVTVMAAGLLDQEGEIPFTPGESSKTSRFDTASEAVASLAIPCRTLDAVMDELKPKALRLVKVDVEGAEARVLAGAVRTIRNYHPHLVVELHNPEQDLAVARQLLEWGYKIERVGGPPIRHLDRAWPDPEGVWGTLHGIPPQDA